MYLQALIQYYNDFNQIERLFQYPVKPTTKSLNRLNEAANVISCCMHTALARKIVFRSIRLLQKPIMYLLYGDEATESI